MKFRNGGGLYILRLVVRGTRLKSNCVNGYTVGVGVGVGVGIPALGPQMVAVVAEMAQAGGCDG